MKVVMIAPHWPPRNSGHGDYSWHLANSLHERGIEMVVVVVGQDQLAPCADPRVSVASAPFPGTVSALRKVVNIVAGYQPDVVLLQFEANAYRLKARPHLLPLALRLKGLSVVVMYHELWPPRRFPRAAKFALLNPPNRVVAFSRWHADGVSRFRRTGREVDIIAVATNITAPLRGNRQLVRTRFGISADDFVISFFGFVLPEHQVDLLVEAVAKVQQAIPGVQLSVIGGVDFVKNSYHQRLARRAKELGIEGRITWHGRVERGDDVARLLCISDVGVLPYDTGVGENNGAFVAMSQYGFPIVTTRGERSSEMESEGVAQFVASDADDIAGAIIQIHDDRTVADRLSERVLAWSQRRTWETLAEGFEQVLDTNSERVIVE